MRAALGALLTLLCQPALAEDLPFAAAARLPDAELAEIRGGFMVRGFDIRFGLTVESRVDGAPLLVSRMSDALPGQALTAGDPGSTFALHLLRDGHLAVLSNRVDGRVLEQIVTLNIDVLNFRAVTGSAAAQSTLRLIEPVRAAALGGLPR
jgi:hypothetical protein